MKRALVMVAVAASAMVPGAALAGYPKGSYQVGAPDCYAQADYSTAPLFNAGMEPVLGAGLHCPILPG